MSKSIWCSLYSYRTPCVASYGVCDEVSGQGSGAGGAGGVVSFDKGSSSRPRLVANFSRDS